MIYTPMPKKMYQVKVGGSLIGLGGLECSQELWNLVTISSRLPFNWELKNLPKLELPATFPNITHAQMDLMKRISGAMISDLVTDLDPMQFSELLWSYDDSKFKHLQLVKYWKGASPWRKVVRGRALAWYKSLGKGVTKKEQVFIDMIVPGFGLRKKKQGGRTCQ